MALLQFKKNIYTKIITLLIVCWGACGGTQGSSGETGAGIPRGMLTTVEYSTDSGVTVKALYRSPEGGESLPAVIYNHGMIVETMGYEGAVAQGYDVANFVNALAEAGYVGLAPIRPGVVSKYSDWTDMIIRSIRYLKETQGVDPNRIFMIGFSKGGLLTLQVTLEHPEDLAGLILMSPAPGVSPHSWSETATSANLQKITLPLFVTLGASEPNQEIVTNVTRFLEDMKALGKSVQSKTDYPGDHSWFYQVRPDYWNDILSFLN